MDFIRDWIGGLPLRVASRLLFQIGVFALAACAAGDRAPTVAAPGLACPPLSERPLSQIATAKVDAIVDEAVAAGFAGGVAIVRRGALAYSRTAGFSDSERQVAVTPATMFHVASVTKYLTAVLVLKAAEEGRLSLGDPIAKYLPELSPGKRDIRISDLLAHRSGLGSSYATEATFDSLAALKAVDGVPYEASKAGVFRYSNDGYDLLAIIVERVFGARYEDVARDRVLKPACLDHSSFWGEARLSDPASVGQPIVPISAELKRRNYGMIGSAGYLTTAADLVRLQTALAGGLVLDQTHLNELWAPRGKISIGQAAYGSFLVDVPALGETISARGAEDWGDNAILNHYRRDGSILAVVTSKGPKEGAGDLYRNTLSRQIEAILAAR